jgi:hypothetical protein
MGKRRMGVEAPEGPGKQCLGEKSAKGQKRFDWNPEKKDCKTDLFCLRDRER